MRMSFMGLVRFAVAVSLAPLAEQAAARPETAASAMATSVRRPGMRRLLEMGADLGRCVPGWTCLAGSGPYC